MRDRSLERRRRAGWLAVVVAGAVLTTSCGDDGGRSTAATSTSTTTRSPAKVLEAALGDLREESGSPGILALVRDGGGERFGTSGSADLDGTPIEASTRFRIGSITKTLTATLVLDAVERGELELGLATYHLACGDYLGHGGAIAGTHTLGLVGPDGTRGLILAANLRGDPEPDLLGTAEELLCGAP